MDIKETKWWLLPKEQTHESVFATVAAMDKTQSWLEQHYLDMARLYGNADILGLNASSYYRTSPEYNSTKRLTYNIIKSCIDTVAAKIAKNKPKPMFLTDGGDWSLQRRAKQLTKFNEGAFYATDLYKKAPIIFRDAAVFGTGLCKLYQMDGELKAERVLPFEIRVNEAESFYNDPRQMHQVKTISREVLAEMYPKAKAEILNANDSAREGSFDRDMADQIAIIESWHLPSSKDAKDGKHTICIHNKTLLTEPWERSRFPFAIMKWSPRLMGWRGMGLSEELMGIQVEINRILKVITQIIKLTVPKLFVEKGSKVVYAHFNTEIGGIVEFSGTKPVYDFLQAVPPDLIKQLETLYARGYEIAGVSQLAAQSKKPTGLDSGKALREFNDIESERFMLIGMEYEDFFMQAADHFVDLAEEIKKDGGSLKMMVPGKKNVSIIDWNEINLERDQYIMQAFPVSSLSNTPAGKLQDVQELLQGGLIPREEALRLLDFPDLESVTQDLVAAQEDIEMIIEQMIEKNNYVSPEPFQNLAYGIKRIQSAYLRAKLNKVPEANLELLRRWVEEANNLITASAPPQNNNNAGLAPLPAEAMPLGVPSAAPTSNLLPFPTAEQSLPAQQII